MYKFGKVTSYDKRTGKATIEYIRPDACAKCGACGMLNQKGSICLKADCAPGNWVRVCFPEGRFLKAAAFAYVLPLVGFLAGLFIGYTLSGQQEGWAVAGGLVGLAVSSLALYLIEKKIGNNPDWVPQVDAVFSEKPDIDAIGCHSAE